MACSAAWLWAPPAAAAATIAPACPASWTASLPTQPTSVTSWLFQGTLLIPARYLPRAALRRWNPAAEELYSGSSDSNIVVWSPASEAVTAERDGWQGRDSDGDDWSD